MSLISVLKRKSKKTFFTTPSHGRRFFICHKFYQWYKSDISEIDEFKPQEALDKAEKNAAKIYGTKYTRFLTNGATGGIIAAILSCGRNKKLLIWDKAHPCHKNGGILADAQIIEYSLEKDTQTGTYRAITPDIVLKLIQIHMPDVIVITSPTYEGFAADVKKISDICKSNGVKLIVDEAHGALYPFSDELPESAVKYADFTVQSLHKTAGGLNPTALLHSNDINPAPALDLITTTSPSYPLLATIEKNVNYLNSGQGKKKILQLIESIKNLKLVQYNDDITKIILKKEGMTGFELSKILFKKDGIEDERTNEVSTMLLCGLGTDDKMLKKLEKALRRILYA